MTAPAVGCASGAGKSAPPVKRGRWRVTFPRDDERLSPEMREEMVARALELAASSAGAPFRRSRHAVTHLVTLGAGGPRGALEVFLKTFVRPAGIAALKAMVRGPRAVHVVRMTAALRAAGFCAPPVLMLGLEDGGRGRGMIATAKVEAEPLPALLVKKLALEQKRGVMRALGAETRRLHRAGFIHGDLTPFNIFVAGVSPPRIIFIDHERTRRAAGERRRLRNLVQLGRFDLKGLTLSDRMRVFDSYAGGLSRAARARLRRRAARMLLARLKRDGEAQQRSSDEAKSTRPAA